MGHIVFGAGKEVIDAKNIVPVFEQTIAQMRTKKTGAAGDECAGVVGVGFHQSDLNNYLADSI